MRTTTQAIELIYEIRRLMELHGENPFKVRAYERAVDALEGREDLDERARAGTLTELEGIGKGISEVLTDFFVNGSTKLRDDLAAALPEGLAELTRVPGLGPKKAKQLIDELEVRSIRDLEYACRENRLLRLKGFGAKMQAKVLEGIHFLAATSGQTRLVDAAPAAEKLLGVLLNAVNEGRHPAAGGLRVSETGALRRKREVLSELEYLVEVPAGELAPQEILKKARAAADEFAAKNSGLVKIEILPAQTPRFGYELARTTGTPEHWAKLGAPNAFDADTEEQVYQKLGVSWIPPESRETGEEVDLARAGKLEALLPWDGVQGVFHNHTTRSDGTATLEEMVVAAKRLGYRYIGISDHSQSAFYAQGLKMPDLLEQESEIRAVREKHPDIRVFWGIESDILADGSLDYDDAVLAKFDFVIASIHSRFQMEREAMTERLLAAIRNPRTRFIGHITGRLLLGRKGYDVDLDRVIAEAAKHDVAIEINANPARLDIDWRWGPQLRKHGARVSVNPDAHDVAGLEDMRYGVAMARKALLTTGDVVNSRSADEIEKWLKRA